MSLRIKFGLSIEHLWPAIVLAGLSFYISLIPLPPNDFWWHLKIGEIISTTGAIPKTNMFSWTLPADFPFTYGAWLGEYLFYWLYRLGGLPLLIFTRTVLATVTFGLVGYEARRRSGSWRIAAWAVALAGMMSLNNLIVRPQNWTWLPFMGFLILLSRYAGGQLRGRWLLACPLIMMFWVNVHGTFVLGIVVAGLFFVGEALRALLKRPGARLWKHVAWLGLIELLVVLATVANPQGAGIWGYVQDLMTDQPSQRLVVEWQSPSPREGLANVMFFISVLAMMAVLAYSRYRLTPTELLLTAGFLWLAWSGQRYVVWFGMVAMPILAQALSELVAAVMQRMAVMAREPFAALRIDSATKHSPGRAAHSALNLLIAVLVFVPVAMVQPWFVERIPLPSSYWKLVWRDTPAGPLLSTQTPLAATEYLKQHPGGKLFNEMAYGSYLIWALPAQGVFVDPRVELYPYEQWLDYIRIANGTRYNELLAHYGVDRLLLDVEKQKELIKSLAADPLWQKEYEDQYTQIWITKASSHGW